MYVDSIPGNAPYAPNENLSTDEPINVDQFLKQQRNEMQSNGKQMFGNNLKSNVFWYGPGTFEIYNNDHETLLWQWRSDASMTFGEETTTLPLNSCIIVPKNVHLMLANNSPDCVTFSVAMPLPE